MKKTLQCMILSFVLLILGVLPALAGALPDLAAEMADELDQQVAERVGGAGGLSLLVTTPVSLGDLEKSCPLARLLAEEMATWFVSMGYRVQEIRKGQSILFAEETGELLLTRKVDLIEQRSVKGALILTGTYTVTTRNVRFNIRLLHAASGEVMAMASGTMRLTGEALELVGDGTMPPMRIRPSVATIIPPRVGQ